MSNKSIEIDTIVRINIEGYGVVEADIGFMGNPWRFDESEREKAADVIAEAVKDALTLVMPHPESVKFHMVLGMPKPEEKLADLKTKLQGVDHSWPIYDH